MRPCLIALVALFVLGCKGPTTEPNKAARKASDAKASALASQSGASTTQPASQDDLRRWIVEELTPRLSGPESVDALPGILNSRADAALSPADMKRLADNRQAAEKILLAELEGGNHAAATLLACMRCQAALPLLRRNLLADRYFYGWEGPDYATEEAYLGDTQYPHHMIYIAAIEAITGKPVHEAVQLTTEERRALEAEAAKDRPDPKAWPEPFSFYAAKFILNKLSAGTATKPDLSRQNSLNASLLASRTVGPVYLSSSPIASMSARSFFRPTAFLLVISSRRPI